MKKIVLLIGLSLLLSTNGYAACAEGTEVTGKNGHVYCRSNIPLNWYSALAWCDAHGRTLATIEQMCDIDETQKWDGNVGSGKCLNIIDAYSSYSLVWTATVWPVSYNSFTVALPSGNVSKAHRTAASSNNLYALCW